MTRLRDAMVWRVLVVALAAVVEVLLRSVTLTRTARVLRIAIGTDAPAAAFRSAPMPRWCASRLDAVEAVAGRWPFGDTCLRRSMLTAVVLRELHPVLRIGWLPTPEGGNAHAWVEVDGRSLDSGLDGIVPFSTR